MVVAEPPDVNIRVKAVKVPSLVKVSEPMPSVATQASTRLSAETVVTDGDAVVPLPAATLELSKRLVLSRPVTAMALAARTTTLGWVNEIVLPDASAVVTGAVRNSERMPLVPLPWIEDARSV